MPQSTPASAYPPASNGVPLSVDPEQYGLQGSSSFMNSLGPTAASQTWPQSLNSFAGYNSRQLGQNSAADHASSLSSLFDQLSVGQASAHGNFQQLTSLSNSQVGEPCGSMPVELSGVSRNHHAEVSQIVLQMLFPRDFDRGLPQTQSLSQSAPGSLQAQLSSLGLSSGPWSSQLRSTVSSQANSTLTSLQLHQQRNGHRPVCRYVLRLEYLKELWWRIFLLLLLSGIRCPGTGSQVAAGTGQLAVLLILQAPASAHPPPLAPQSAGISRAALAGLVPPVASGT